MPTLLLMMRERFRELRMLGGLGVMLVVAVAVRLTAVSRYVTPDELIWVYRSVQFREALLAGAWADTLTTGHPGVLTMWLGNVGISLQLWLQPTAGAAYAWINQLAWYAPENRAALSQLATFLTGGRVAVAVVNSVGILIIYGLLRGLVTPTVALLAASWLILDPFVAGLSGLLHVDGLMTTFATIALLALALLFQDETRGWPYALLAGVMTGLAILSKSPALVLVPFTAVAFLMALVWRQKRSFVGQWRYLLKQGVVWLSGLLLTAWLLFPALWVGPLAVWNLMTGNANRHIDNALRPTFFMGEAAFDHGPVFYPVAVAFRLSPLVLVGVAWLLLRLVRRRHKAVWPLSGLLVGWPLFFLLSITVAAKKFDRYALPAIPALIILGALAWAGREKGLTQRGTAVLIGIQALLLVWTLPYPLASYNPLLGGAWVAQDVLTVGWGEGIGAAGSWLSQLPDAAEKRVATDLPPALAPFFVGETVAADVVTMAQADYIVISANSRQLNPDIEAMLPETAVWQHTVRFGGLDQAWVYVNEMPEKGVGAWQSVAESMTFGNEVHLLATSVQADEAQIDVGVQWQLVVPTNGRFMVKVTVADEAGLVWQGMETALLNEVYFYPEHWQSGEVATVWYRLPRLAAMPPGVYHVAVSLLVADTGEQLPLLGADGGFDGVAYVPADFIVPPLPTPANVSLIDIPVWQNVPFLAGDLTLLGHGGIPARLLAGSQAVLDVYWQSHAPLPADMAIHLQVGDEVTLPLALSVYDTAVWRTGEVVQAKYLLALPPTFAAGRYSLSVMLPDTAERYTLGMIEVVATARLFTLPEDVAQLLDYRFGGEMALVGVDVGEGKAGEMASLTLYWQTAVQPTTLYTGFVHLLDEAGNIVAQRDQWPGGLPSDTWAAGEVIVDEVIIALPPDLPAGRYELGVGVYTAVDGQRLPVTDGQEGLYPDGRVVLPVPLVVQAAES